MIVKVTKEKKKYFKDLREIFKIDYLNELEKNPFYNLIVYVDEKKPKAYLSYNYLYDRYEIVNFEVIDEYRNLGIGSKLLLYLIALGEKELIKNISLEVKINSRACDLYRRHGFVDRAIRKAYYDGIDAILMEKEMMKWKMYIY